MVLTTKKNNYNWLIGSFIILFTIAGNYGCQKETLNDALPVVQMTSVKQFGSDSVAVKGTIVSNNGDDVQYEGFCYGTQSMPPITQNQVLFQNDSATFSAHLYANPDSTYYFRCFAANSYGYALSSPLK